MTSRPRALRHLYDDLNARYWDGRLPPSSGDWISAVYDGPIATRPIVIRRVGIHEGAVGLRASRGQRDRICCRALFIPPGDFRPGTIRVLGMGGLGERRALLHEMCHASVYYAEPHEADHGPIWRAEMRRLAVEHGETWAAEQADRYDEPLRP